MVEKLEKISTGIPNLDWILKGGIPKYSVNIIAGPPGTGKTILAQQIVFRNAEKDSSAPYLVTVSEPTVKMIRYQQQFSFWDSEKIGKNIVYLDIGSALLKGGLEATTEQIEQYIEEYSPTILAIDSFKAIQEVAESAPKVREFSYALAVRLSAWECTTFLVGEYTRADIDTQAIFAIADGIILLDREEKGMQTQRILEVVKMRGDGFFSGKHPFNITSDGIQVFPRIKTPDKLVPYPAGAKRVSCGVEGLDKMMMDGLPQGTVTLVAGGAGTGKTLLALHFLLEGIKQGEPGVLVTFQETPSLLRTFCKGFGWDLEKWEKEGLLNILYTSPVEIGVDEHAAAIKEVIASIGVKRVAVDSLKDIEIATPDKVRYKDYVYSLVNFFRAGGITSLLTNEIPELFGTFVMSEHGISFISDNVILLRYVEIESRISRAISVLKMRGSNHAKEVREYRITSSGMEVLEPFKAYGAVLSGAPTLTQVPGSTFLPPRAERMLEAVNSLSSATAADLGRITNEKEAQAEEVLNSLVQLGYVVRYSKNNETYYKPSVVWSRA